MVGDKTPVPENSFIDWTADDVQDTVLEVLAQVNDNLAAAGKGCYFGLIPSRQNGLEVAFFEEDSTKKNV
jgi:hypothetical protein